MKVATVFFVLGASTGLAVRVAKVSAHDLLQSKEPASSCLPYSRMAYVPGGGTQVEYFHENDKIWKVGTLGGKDKDDNWKVKPTGWKEAFNMGPVRRLQGVDTLVVGSKCEVKLTGGEWRLATIMHVDEEGLFEANVDGWEATYKYDTDHIREPTGDTGLPPAHCVIELGVGSCVEVKLSGGKWQGGVIRTKNAKSGEWRVEISDFQGKPSYNYNVNNVRPAGFDTMTIGTEVVVQSSPDRKGRVGAPRKGVIEGVRDDGQFLVRPEDWKSAFTFPTIAKVVPMSDAASACQQQLELVSPGFGVAVCAHMARRGLPASEIVALVAHEKGVTIAEADLDELCATLSRGEC